MCGKVIVAADEEEVIRLDEIYQRGIENEIEGIKMVSGEELRQIEPYAAGVRAIHVPCAGIVDFPGVCRKLSEKLTLTGHTVRFSSEVMAVIQTNGLLTVKLKSDSVRTRFFINCAGLHSDRVAKRSGVNSPVKIVPFRGEYFELTPEAARKVNGLIYPLPNPDFPFLGVHFTRMALGGVECGPNAVFSFKREGYKKTSFDVADTIETVDFPGFWTLSRKHWKTGLDEMYRSFYKTGFIKRSVHLIQPRFPMFPGEGPETGKINRFYRVCYVEGGFFVTLSFERKDSIGPALHSAKSHPGKMDTQEGEIRVGEGIDQTVHLAGSFRSKLKVFAPKGYNFNRGVHS